MSSAAQAYEREHPDRPGRHSDDRSGPDDQGAPADPRRPAGSRVRPARRPARFGFRTLLGLPIVREGRVAGVFDLGRPEVRPFTEDEIALVATSRVRWPSPSRSPGCSRRSSASGPSLPGSSRLRSPPLSRARRASSSWPAIGARSPPCSATFGASPTSRRRPSPRSCLGCCATTTACSARSIVEHGGDPRALRRRWRPRVLQRPDPPGRPRGAGGPAGRRDAGAVRRARRRLDKLGYELGLGVGVATGYATLGRIGFEGRYDYAAIGNAVILASRLSSDARAGQILVSQRSMPRSRRPSAPSRWASSISRA